MTNPARKIEITPEELVQLVRDGVRAELEAHGLTRRPSSPPRAPIEVTETDRAAARAAARRLGLVVRERGGDRR